MALKANILIDQGTSFATSIDVTDENGNIVPQDLTEQPFVYYMVGALKKAITEIEGLQSQVQKLSDKIDALENKNI